MQNKTLMANEIKVHPCETMKIANVRFGCSFLELISRQDYMDSFSKGKMRRATHLCNLVRISTSARDPLLKKAMALALLLLKIHGRPFIKVGGRGEVMVQLLFDMTIW